MALRKLVKEKQWRNSTSDEEKKKMPKWKPENINESENKAANMEKKSEESAENEENSYSKNETPTKRAVTSALSEGTVCESRGKWSQREREEKRWND